MNNENEKVVQNNNFDANTGKPIVNGGNNNSNKKGLAIASMVLGIVAILGSWIPVVNIGSIILALVGLGLGIPSLVIWIKHKRGSLAMSIVGLVLSVLTIISAVLINLAVYYLAEESIDDVLNDSYVDSDYDWYDDDHMDDVEVTFGSYIVDSSSYFESGELNLTVKNVTNETSNFFISVEALDVNGTRIAKDLVSISNLAAGQSVNETAFYFEDIALMQTAVSFNVYEVDSY